MNNDFSLALGIVDYFNPILMTIFFFYTVRKVKKEIATKFFIPYICGYVLVLCAGFMIPTYKCVVGLTDLEFELPVKFVTVTNIGFMIAGFSIFLGTLKVNQNKVLSVISPVSLFNSFIVIFGAAGLILIYVSYIKLALRKQRKIAIVFFAYSLLVTLGLAFVGAALDETLALIHWIEEIVNISGMLALCIGGYMLFKEKMPN
ncbi:MAG: hypothetical protein K6G30_14425 [Acetatifactor sp.]|nr:hypothetical protein [Acetatifactor sp.]